MGFADLIFTLKSSSDCVINFRVFPLLCLLSFLLLVRGQVNTRSQEEEAVFDKIKNTLEKTYRDDDKKINAIISHLKKKQNNFKVRDFNEPYLKNNPEAFDKKVKENLILQSYVKYYDGRLKLVTDFKSKVLDWYPHFSEIIEGFTKYLWGLGLGDWQVKRFTKNPNEFKIRIDPYLRNYKMSGPALMDGINSAIDLHAIDILKNDLNVDQARVQNALDSIKKLKGKKFNNVALLYDRESLKELLESGLPSKSVEKVTQKPKTENKVKSTMTARPTQESLKDSLDKLYPDFKELNTKFATFVNTKRVNATFLRNLAANNKTFSTLAKALIDDFFTSNRNFSNSFLQGQVTKIVNAEYPQSKADVLDSLKKIDLSKEFSAQMLYTPDDLKAVVVEKVNKAECYRKIADWVEELSESEIPATLSKEELKSYFSNNSCLASEVCIKKSPFASDYKRFLNDTLYPYVDSLKEPSSSVKPKVSNVADEIDETIYELIRDIFPTSTSKSNANCVIDYMIREKITEFYSADLLFDDAKLKSKLKEIIEQYEEKFNTV